MQNDRPLLVMPNAYLRQWGGRQVRVKEPAGAPCVRAGTVPQPRASTQLESLLEAAGR